MSYYRYDGALAVETAAPTNGLYGTDGVDTLTGTAGADSLWGGQGDLMVGGLGDDTYYVKSVNDRVVEAAGGGTDKIVAWTSIKLTAYANVENLEVDGDKTYGAGNAGDNIIVGGAGSQQLYGGNGGQDVLVGGAGADTFIIVKGQGNDVVQDFTPGDGDVVRLSAGYTSFAQVQSHLSQVGNDVKLDLGDGQGLVFRNLQVGQLTASSFQLQLDASKLGAMTFHDEFSGPLSLWDAESNPTGTWRPDFGYQGSQGVGSYTLTSNNESEIYVSPYFRDHAGDFSITPFSTTGDGTLTITAQAVQSGASSNSELFGYGYTSGMISTQPTFAQTYGYFEMRAELPHAAGAWPAFWLIPADGSWPPELDVMETLTSDPNADWTTAHSGTGGVHTANGVASYIPDTVDGFHTYGVLWTATDLTWYVDGVAVFHEATPADMNKPMYMIANLAVGGWGGTIDNAAMPAEMKIDYIRAYSLADGNSTSTTTSGAATDSDAVAGSGSATGSGAATTAGAVFTSGQYADTLIGGAGADTINAGQGPDRLTGGAGADAFVFRNMPWNAGHITDFQVGVDRLDISALYTDGYAGSDPVANGYVTFVSNGAGGTTVLLDTDGAGAANTIRFQIATLDGVSPTGLTAAQVFGAPTTSSPATVSGVSLTSAGPGSTLAGGAGADTLHASQGADTLTGGAGADHFVFDNLPWSAGHITDFTPGVDVLDLRPLFTAAGYHGADPLADGYLKFESDGAGDTKVYFDSDGPGTANPWPILVTILDGVAPTSLHGSDWLFH